MVLKNLLVCGEDAKTGYDINDWNKRTDTVTPQPSAAVSGYALS